MTIGQVIKIHIDKPRTALERHINNRHGVIDVIYAGYIDVKIVDGNTVKITEAQAQEVTP